MSFSFLRLGWLKFSLVMNSCMYLDINHYNYSRMCMWHYWQVLFHSGIDFQYNNNHRYTNDQDQSCMMMLNTSKFQLNISLLNNSISIDLISAERLRVVFCKHHPFWNLGGQQIIMRPFFSDSSYKVRVSGKFWVHLDEEVK